jgi:hypothetical protein
MVSHGFALKVKAVGVSKTTLPLYRTTRRYAPEVHDIHIHHHDNNKTSYTYLSVYAVLLINIFVINIIFSSLLVYALVWILVHCQTTKNILQFIYHMALLNFTCTSSQAWVGTVLV